MSSVQQRRYDLCAPVHQQFVLLKSYLGGGALTLKPEPGCEGSLLSFHMKIFMVYGNLVSKLFFLWKIDKAVTFDDLR